MEQSEIDRWHMQRALALATQGEGYVEPNPMVGCVIAQGAEVIGEGWHRRYGGDHAEVDALRVAGARARGATAYVTLEPCCHFGKTPPCTHALIASGIARVVAAQTDPFPQVAGQGLAALAAARIAVETGVLEAEAKKLNAPYRKLLATGRPWTIAKWAMTLDGKIATRTGDSRWISNPQSRAIVHRLRGRVDAIAVGGRTAQIDDPLLTARPPGPRIALRIVLDRQARISSASKLVQTARQIPLLIVVGPDTAADDRRRLEQAGAEILVVARDRGEAWNQLLAELGRRRITNLLVEGGGQVLGSLWDLAAVDEVHAFIAPRIVGGTNAPGPVGGEGRARIADGLALEDPQVEDVGGDVYLHGRLMKDQG